MARPWGLFLFDVCEEMKLDEVRSILGARRLGEGMKHAAAEQLFFERPPVLEEVEFHEDPKARVRVKYYDYGVLSVLVDFPFAGAWPDFVSLASPLDFWHRPAEPCREDRKGKSSANPAGVDRTLRKKRLARSGLKP